MSDIKIGNVYIAPGNREITIKDMKPTKTVTGIDSYVVKAVDANNRTIAFMLDSEYAENLKPIKNRS